MSSSETKYLLSNVPDDIPAWANVLVTVIKDLVGEIKTNEIGGNNVTTARQNSKSRRRLPQT